VPNPTQPVSSRTWAAPPAAGVARLAVEGGQRVQLCGGRDPERVVDLGRLRKGPHPDSKSAAELERRDTELLGYTRRNRREHASQSFDLGSLGPFHRRAM